MAIRDDETARRGAICIRACEGIPSRLLEGGFIMRLIAECVHLEDERVRAILNELADAKPDRRRGPRRLPRAASG